MKYLFFVSLIGWIVLSFVHFPLPSSDQILPQMINSNPIQQKIDYTTSVININNIRYRITPLYRYSISGLVVADYDSNNWLDVTHKGDPAQTKDLCLIWGKNLANGVYRDLVYRHGEFTCYVDWKVDQLTLFNQSQLSNNHLIPANPKIATAIKQAKIGDQVLITGQLVNYEILGDNGNVISFRNTSTIREDNGCEIILVSGFEILKAGLPVSTIKNILMFVSVFSGLFIILRYLIWPPQPDRNFIARPEKTIKNWRR